MSPRRVSSAPRRALALVGLFALATLAHVESLSYWFVSTDVLPLIESSRVSSFAGFVGLFAEPLMDGTRFTEVGLFYRPVSSLTYAFDYALWGLDPFGYHLTNLLLHGLAAVLVAVAVTALLDRPLVGYSSALLFAAHPLTAEVVPTAARRQDVLVTVFVLAALALFVRAHREDSRSALVASLLAYLLALGSKEIGIVLPGLIAAWVFIRPDLSTGSFASDGNADGDAGVRPGGIGGTVRSDGGHARQPHRLVNRETRVRATRSLRALVPFLAVTIAYLLVRVAVLGGLGGYDTSLVTVGDLALVPIDYLLSITYHSNVIWAAVRASPGWIVVLVPAVVLVGLGIDRLGARPSRLRSLAMVTRVGFVYGFGLLAYLLVFGPELVRSFPDELRYPWVAALLVSTCFAVGCLSGVAALLLARDPPLGAVGSALAFIGVWLLVPVALFYLGGEFTMRSGYPFVAPAMAALAMLAIDGVRAVRGRRGDRNRNQDRTPAVGANVAMLGLVALLVLPQMAVSPLFHPYDGWETAGEINRRTLSGLSTELDGVPEDTRIVVSGLSGGVGEQRRAFPRVESIGFLQENSIESWLRLRDSGSTVRVTVVDRSPIPRTPQEITFETTRSGEKIVIDVRYRFDR